MNLSSESMSMQPSWWADEPSYRGTYSLVSSCIFTLGLCVWTAIHLNIPEQSAGARQFFRKLTWLAVGLLAPEVVTFTAWNQRETAARLVRELATAHTPKESLWQSISRWGRKNKYEAVEGLEMHYSKSAASRISEDWNLVHGFYAVMGGYAIDVSTGDPFLPNGIKRLTLTSDGVRFLLQNAPDLVPRVSEEDINDKSKADGLAKLLVALQAGWFCLQCIARGAQRLPISLLEITTGGHALYTLFTYVLWAQKPMNITVPTLITGDNERLRSLCAYMFMCSRISGEKGTTAYESTGGPPVEEFHWIEPWAPGVPSHSLGGFVTLKDGYSLEGTEFVFRREPKNVSGLALLRKGDKLEELRLNDVGALRWRLAWEGMRVTGAVPGPCEYMVARASNVPTFDSWEHAPSRMILAFTAAELVYATIHALGWNASFASSRLQLAWRTASCIIGGGGIFLGVSFAWAAGESTFRSETFSAVVVIGVLEFGVRMFLLIEAVLNVAVLPAGVYQLPHWSVFIPHWA
ncbi:hypothetical protein FB451DRAFT_1273373 [Mycena latifolia]|nr:hypothetical protein FB451DRAFT_1273373 [Mycena latifolia]